jgi:single-stranded-DNA-specific exonuclease
MRWVLPREEADRARALAGDFGLHPVAARVLISRGYDQASVATFLETDLKFLPDPFSMLGMDAAVARIQRAIAHRERITLYGDYDVDGVSATALLSLFLTQIGAEVSTYIPHRLFEGYGLNDDAVRRIASGGTRLLITLDCGISAVSEIDKAVSAGLEVIVVDHHQVGDRLPRAAAILNPHQPGCAYSSKHLCATGVAFCLAMALRKQLREAGAFTQRPEPNLRAYLDLVALATIADVVPILGANRVLVRHGLVEIERAARPGIRALKQVAGVAADAPVTTGQIGYRMGPRLNAAGRLDDASVGLRLLMASSDEEARPLAKALDDANAERQAIERRILDEATADARPMAGKVRGLVLAREGWHPGVIGIVASRIVERFHRPAVLVALKEGVGRGSGRSVEAFHLYEALRDCSGHLSRFGGHKAAAGLTVDSSQLTAFRSAFEEIAASRLTDEDLEPRCRIDACVDLHELDESLISGLDAIGPFGNSNPEPVLAFRRVKAIPRVVGAKDRGSGHLKLKFDQARHLDAIGFGMGDRIATASGTFDAAFAVGIDEWNGTRRVQLRVKALREAT